MRGRLSSLHSPTAPEAVHVRLERGQADATARRHRAEVTGVYQLRPDHYSTRGPDEAHFARLIHEAYVENVNARIWPATTAAGTLASEWPTTAIMAEPEPVWVGYGPRRRRPAPATTTTAASTAARSPARTCPRKCGRTFRTAAGLAWHVDHWPTCATGRDA